MIDKPTTQQEAVARGISHAFDAWLAQNDVATPELIEAGVEQAVAAWLAAHSDQLIAAIAKAVVDNSKES